MEDSSLYKGERSRRPRTDPRIREERTFVRQAIHGDSYAFALLYDRYVEKIFKYIYYKTGSKSDAEDLTAQVFLRAWEAIGGYRLTERPFSAWLYRIAHNLVVDYFRVRRDTVPLENVAPLEQQDQNLEDLTERQLTAETLQRAIRHVTNDQRQVILLRFIEGYSTEEVAHIMGKGQGAIRTLQHRALASLGRVFRRGKEQL